MSAGGGHTCGLTTSGAAYCWGGNTYGQLGGGSTNDGQTTPIAVTGGLIFESVSAGRQHYCGVTPDGAAYCWGIGDEGQLGNGSKDNQLKPVAVSGGLTFASVSPGFGHTCGVTNSGAAYCWGGNWGGQLGNGSRDRQTTPRAVSGGLAFASVFASGGHSCGVTTSGATYCWGGNAYGQIGDGGASRGDNPTTPVATSGGLALASVNGGVNHACGVTTSGGAYCWGWEYSGRLGNGTDDNTSQRSPVAVSGGLTFDSVSLGELHTCGVATSGAAYCWGLGDDRLGSDLTDFKATPVQATPVAVSGGLAFASVSAGLRHTCGLTTSGAAYCWGIGGQGQLGNGSKSSQTTPVAVAAPASGQ